MSSQPYIPDELPLNNLDHRLLLPLVGQANAALARYDGLLQSIPNPAVMLSPLTTQEAVLSSKIEAKVRRQPSMKCWSRKRDCSRKGKSFETSRRSPITGTLFIRRGSI